MRLIGLLAVLFLLIGCYGRPPESRLPDAISTVRLDTDAAPQGLASESGSGTLVLNMRNPISPNCGETTIALVRKSNVSESISAALNAGDLPTGLIDLSLLYPEQVKLLDCTHYRQDGKRNVAEIRDLEAGPWLLVLFVDIPNSSGYVIVSGQYISTGLPERCQVYQTKVDLKDGEVHEVGFWDLDMEIQFVPRIVYSCFQNVTY